MSTEEEARDSTAVSPTPRPSLALMSTSTLIMLGCVAVMLGAAIALRFTRGGPWVHDLLFALPALVFALVLMRRLKLSYATIAIIGLALVLYYAYFGYTSFGERNHDGPSHLKYIKHIVEKRELPNRDTCFVCHHPPVYYGISAAIFRFAQLSKIVKDPVRAVQAFSLLLSFVFVLFGALTIRRFSPKRSVIALGTALIAFWPYTILNSVRLHNDVMVSTTMGVAFYFLVCWYQDDRWRDLWLCAAFGVLSVLSKSSGYLVIAAIGLVGSYRLLFERNRLRQLGRLVPVLLVSAAACGTFAFMRGMDSDTDTRHKTFGTAYTIHPRDFVGNEPFNYLYFDVESFLREPYIMARLDGSGRQYYWNHLLKSSLFATHNTVADVETSYRFNRRMAEVMNFLLLAMLIYSIAAACTAKRGGAKRFLVPLVTTGTVLAGHITFKGLVPAAHHNDFRMVYPVLIAWCLAYTMAVEQFREKRLLLGRIGSFMGIVFVSMAAFYYLPKFEFIVRYLPKKVLRHTEVSLKTTVRERTDWDKPGNTIIFGDELLEMELAPLRTISSLDITADHNDQYQLIFYGQKETRSVVVGPKMDKGFKGLARYQQKLDPPVKKVRAVRVQPLGGDRHYSIGHLIVGRGNNKSNNKSNRKKR